MKYYAIINTSEERYNDLYCEYLFKTREEAERYITELQLNEEQDFGYTCATSLLKAIEMEVYD